MRPAARVDSALLRQMSCAAPRSQHELVTLHDQVESVPGGKPESVPDSLGHDDAAGPVKANCATHDDILPWRVLLENGIGSGTRSKVCAVRTGLGRALSRRSAPRRASSFLYRRGSGSLIPHNGYGVGE